LKKKIINYSLPQIDEVDLGAVDFSGGISVFLPAYNEEENIEKAVRSSVEVLETITDNYEVLVVNDASTDKTAEIVGRMVSENPHIRMVTHQKNTRLGGAIRTGFKESSKEIVFYCDADNPVDMWDVKRAIPLLADHDLVAGFRKQREERIHRLIYSRVYNKLISLVFGIDAYDINFSFKLVRKKVLNEVEVYSNGGFIDAEFIVEAIYRGFKMCRVGVEYYPRAAGESTMASFGAIIKIIREMIVYYKKFKQKF